METSELRIGNLVLRRYFNPNPKDESFEYTPCFVKAIKQENISITLSIKDKAILSKIPYSSIEPIPLNEDWLIKAGFFCFGKKRNWYDSGALSISTSGGVAILFPNGWQTLPTKIAYVHQLQNLYFALAGQELTFNK